MWPMTILRRSLMEVKKQGTVNRKKRKRVKGKAILIPSFLFPFPYNL